MYINNSRHMTKMATVSIYGKTPSKIFFSGTGGPISKNQCNVYKNYNPVMTLTYFTARSCLLVYIPDLR